MIQLLSELPVKAPNPPAIPPTIAVTIINDMLLGRENISATRIVSIEFVWISVMVAIKNHKMEIPRNPATNDDAPFVEMITLIRKLAITTDHHGNIV